MAEMTVSEAQAGLHDLLERVAAGDEVTITRHGQPVAVVVRPDALRVRRAPMPPRAGLSAQAADELIATVRAGRERS